MATTLIIILTTIIIGVGSIYFFGNDNPIEKEAEDILEYELDIPQGRLNELLEKEEDKSKNA